MNRYYFIYEEAYTPPNLQILSESADITEGKRIPKVTAKATLQTANVKNQNNRVYSPEVLSSVVQQLQPKAQSRRLYMEIDHPFVAGTVDQIKKRAVVVSLKESGALLNDIKFDGKNVIGTFETLTSFKGPDLYNLIVYDKGNIGFSLRAFGSVDPQPDGSIIVRLPIKAVTYDIVTNPSDKSAQMVEFLPEEANEFFVQDMTLLESETTEELICDGNNCVVSFIEEAVKDIVKYNLTKKPVKILF